jgi:hypothetical protein
MPKKERKFKHIESEQLLSINGLTCDGSFSSSSCPSSSSSSSSCSSSSCSSSSCPSSSSYTSSSCPSSSSEQTELTYNSSSTYSSSSNECVSTTDNTSSSSCIKVDKLPCHKLIKKYNHAREEMAAMDDIVHLLEFLMNNLQSVLPNLKDKHYNCCVLKNIKWIESYIDTLFCVLRKNRYKRINVKDSKLANDEECQNDRIYVLKIRYRVHKHVVTKIFTVSFNWSRLTFNNATGFADVIKQTIDTLHKQIELCKAESTRPLLLC